ncbi:hypothetical protein PMIT1313_00900 [Prochlorococcus marinus str. MIT 1313]|nr:hypothetical protein PMIT1313_00900 [Prochlorococcus marinus str. MIT 1313]
MQITFGFYNENVLSHILAGKDFIPSAHFHKGLFLCRRLGYCIRRTNLPASSQYSLRPISMDSFQLVALRSILSFIQMC